MISCKDKDTPGWVLGVLSIINFSLVFKFVQDGSAGRDAKGHSKGVHLVNEQPHHV